MFAARREITFRFLESPATAWPTTRSVTYLVNVSTDCAESLEIHWKWYLQVPGVAAGTPIPVSGDIHLPLRWRSVTYLVNVSTDCAESLEIHWKWYLQVPGVAAGTPIPVSGDIHLPLRW